uniref:Ovostatin n=1 Tax=Globodera pallida TaxID=36090 RepID=A0A183BZ67_GLOPA
MPAAICAVRWLPDWLGAVRSITLRALARPPVPPGKPPYPSAFRELTPRTSRAHPPANYRLALDQILNACTLQDCDQKSYEEIRRLREHLQLLKGQNTRVHLRLPEHYVRYVYLCSKLLLRLPTMPDFLFCDKNHAVARLIFYNAQRGKVAHKLQLGQWIGRKYVGVCEQNGVQKLVPVSRQEFKASARQYMVCYIKFNNNKTNNLNQYLILDRDIEVVRLRHNELMIGLKKHALYEFVSQTLELAERNITSTNIVRCVSGTVQPSGNYHIFVRTVPSTEVTHILQSYDDKICSVENEIIKKNAAWMKYKIIPELREERFKAEYAYGVLGNGTITDGTKFEIKLDWKKAHDAYFMRKFDPIYVQIYAVNEPLKTSLVERILINPSPEVEYEFIYGTPRDQIGVQKFLLGQIQNGTENMEKYAVKVHSANRTVDQINNAQMVETDTDGKFEIEFASDKQAPQEFYLSFYEASKIENKNPTEVKPKVLRIDDPTILLMFGNEINVNIDFQTGKWTTVKRQSDAEMKFKAQNIWEIRGLIENVPEFDGCKATKIEVALFSSDPRNYSMNTAGPSASSSSSSTTQEPLKNVVATESETINGSYIFSIDGVQTADLSSIETKKSALFGLRTKSLKKLGTIYVMLTPTEFVPSGKGQLFQHKLTYPTLTQMVEHGGEMAQCRYKFGKNGTETDNGEIAMGTEKEKMAELYQAYLERAKKSSTEIRDEIDAFKVSLQMVHMKPMDK